MIANIIKGVMVAGLFSAMVLSCGMGKEMLGDIWYEFRNTGEIDALFIVILGWILELFLIVSGLLSIGIVLAL